MTETRRTVAATRHYKIIEKTIGTIPMQRYYTVIILDDDGKEIGWNKAFTLDDAYDMCYQEIHIRATGKPHTFRSRR